MPRPSKNAAKPSPKIPPWLTQHFRQSLNAHEKLFQIVHISERGISALRGMPGIFKVMAKVEGTVDQEKSLKQIEAIEKEAALAQTEVDEDFPVLHSFAVVALWSWIEHFIKGLITLWLLNRKDAFANVAVQRLKVKVGDYVLMSKNEQAAYLAELLEQELASPLKKGVNRFESLLEPFGLSGSFSDKYAKKLFELQQVRNVIAHSNGKADRRLRVECPWLKLKLNQPVHVSQTMLTEYAAAAAGYLLEVLYRVGDVYETNLRQESAHSKEENLSDVI